ncbi:FecR domain-containing protein [Chitinophaga niabensis]|uniref:FecR family protein n=1 Tax=Chitinophaga niabensis TaxID=536979 RepID=UPI0031BA86C8
MDQEQLSKLLDKYQAGTCTPEEEEQVLNWLNSRNTDQGEWHNMTATAQQAYLDALYKDVRQSIKIPARRQPLRMILRVAAIAVVVLGAALMYILMNRPEQMETIESLAGTKRIQLPDGSVVVLNAASKLHYMADWETREVILEGEAFFDVKASSELPFVITSGEVRTRVLGTSFNIQAYPKDGKISVGVITGKVEMSKAAEKIILEKGEAGVFDKQQGKLSHGVFQKEPEAWVKGELNFFHMPLSEVTVVLQRHYDVSIEISNNSSKQCEITGRFHVNQTIDEVLQLICKTIDATYKADGKRVIIHAENGCHH